MQTNEKTVTLSSADAGGDVIEEYYDFNLCSTYALATVDR